MTADSCEVAGIAWTLVSEKARQAVVDASIVGLVALVADMEYPVLITRVLCLRMPVVVLL